MDRILALTLNTATNTGAAHYSPGGTPGSLVQMLDASVPLQRCLVGDVTLYAGGDGTIHRSDDGGVTWSTEAIGNPGTIMRSICEPDPIVAYVADTKSLYRSIEGDPFMDLPLPVHITKVYDCCWINGRDGFVIGIDSSFKSHLLYTDNMGDSWTSVELNDLANWPVNGVVRRIAYQETQGGVIQLLLLTSHNLLKVSYLPGPVPGTMLQPRWNFVGQVQPLFNASLPPPFVTGYDGSEDQNILFDRIHLRGDQVWLGGYYGLRAHSFGGGAFVLNAPPTFRQEVSSRQLCMSHASFNAGRIYVASGESGYVAPAYYPGLWGTLDGLTYSEWQSFDGKWMMADVSVRSGDPVRGCTLPSACNYESEASIDDGGCMESVKLTSCTDGSVVYSNAPAILRLACRPPALRFQAGNVSGGNVQIGISVNGVLVVDYSASGLTGTAAEQTAEFVGGLIGWINSMTSMRARFVPAADNIFTPGLPGSVMVTMPPGTPGLQNVGIVWSGMAGVQYTPQTDQEVAGKVVTLVEYPGVCFKVCGPGNCGQVEPLTLTGQYENCSTCKPPTPSTSTFSCTDCDSQLKVDGIRVSPATRANPICIGAGSVLDYTIRSRFKHRDPEYVVPHETGSVLPAGQPPVLTFDGDMRDYFPVGSVVRFIDNTGNEYVVTSVELSSVLDVTTVRFAGSYSGGGLEAVSVFNNCTSSVVVATERIDILDGSEVFTMLDYRMLPSVDDYVEYDFTLSLTEMAGYRVSIISSDCAGVKTCTYYFRVCSQLVAREIDCHRFQVELLGVPQDTPGNYTVDIHDLGSDTTTSRQVTALQFPVEIIGDMDTVYRVSVRTPDGIELGTEIIDLCDLLKCRASIAMSIFCEDPCKAGTLTCEEREQRLELSRISLLSAEIERLVYNTRYEWLGIPNMTEKRYADYINLGRLVASARKVSARCAKCSKKRENCEPCSKS